MKRLGFFFSGSRKAFGILLGLRTKIVPIFVGWLLKNSINHAHDNARSIVLPAGSPVAATTYAELPGNKNFRTLIKT
jgi:hypothetical protein